MKKLYIAPFLMLIAQIGYSAVLNGNYGYTPWTTPGNSANTVFDASNATFIEANSTQALPIKSRRCDSNGPLPVNRYPVNLRNSPGMTLSRALVAGEVPLDSVWGPTYCNSTAIYINNNAYNTTVDGVRVNAAWDGIRVAFDNANNFTIKRSWLTNVRDDCVENDAYNSGRIEDSLFDGCFQGISMREGKSGSSIGNAENKRTVVLDRVLMRMKAHKHSERDGSRERFTSGNMFKATNNTPSVIVTNSIFAYDTPQIDGSPGSDSNLTSMIGKNASKLKSCSNNKILWMYNNNPPAVFNQLHDCFTIVSGQAAVDEWNQARCNWINNHPSSVTRRYQGDPETCGNGSSTPAQQPTPVPTPAAVPVPVAEPGPEVIPGSGENIVVQGDFGYTAWTTPLQSVDRVFDASTATFVVANSTQLNPVVGSTCNSNGPASVNKYPVKLRYSSGMTLLRALIDGEVPLDSVWGPTSCNSAAVIIDNNASNTTIDGVRIDAAWDGVRAAYDNANNFTIKRSWLSNVRDDCVEDSAFNSGKITDSLFDGCFNGISLRESSGSTATNAEFESTVVIDGLLMRLKAHNHSNADGSSPRFTSGHVFKATAKSPAIVVSNSVFAYDTPAIDSDLGGDQNLTLMLGEFASKLKSCSNNKILWMFDNNPPAVFNQLHSCFTLVTGQKAVTEWHQARCNWINAHPETVTRRHPGDPESCSYENPGLSPPMAPVLRITL